MRYHLVTLGCPKNAVDSEHLTRLLAQARHEPVAEPREADVLVVNTCGFIDASIEESTRTVQELAAGKLAKQKLIVAGCMTQLYGPQLKRQVPEVDAVFGVNQWEQIAESFGPSAGDTLDIPATSGLAARPSAYLKISDGCNRPCTFCIIPTIKGPMASNAPEQLLEQGRSFVNAGVKELVLVAQDSTDYAGGLGRSEGLADLLLRLTEELPSLHWLRLMYAYPGAVSPRLARVMASLPQVCNYIDVPLQHGSQSVLRRMKRPSNPDTVRQMIDRLRTEMPDVAIRTTFIVGSPGESEAEFEELLLFAEEMQFDRVGVFTYSPQKGTPMQAMPGQLSEKVKRRRYRELMELQQGIAYRKNAAQIGRQLDVLVESEGGQHDEEGPIFVGRTYRDAPEVDGLAICRGEAVAGDLVRVKITGAGAYDVFGAPVHEVTLV
ncbi:MAG TPA: 30S ribosomal protein S12 methylthiotransferase RimO [Dehalococcoidia bacterium]|nr:30S ribosomal protein S12 methylthiotransferase RimO [Dehalococcoidia bacterium]